MKTQINEVMAAFMLAISVATSVHAGDVYTSGFEAPTFALGPLNGQDGWFINGTGANITVQNGVVNSGAQAASIAATGAVSGTKGVRLVGPVNGMVEVAINARFSSAGTISGEWRLDLFNQAALLIGGIRIFASGDIHTWTGGDTGLDIVRDAWTEFRVICDFNQLTYCVVVDGILVGTDLPMMSAATAEKLGVFAFSVSGPPGTDTGYFDNFRVSSPTVYGTGFEAPTFAPGGLVGQDGWAGLGTTANMNVQNAIAKSGAQAVQFDATGTSNGSAASRAAAVSGVVSISCDMRFASAATHSEWRLYAIGDVGFIGGPIFNSAGDVLYLGGTTGDTGFDLTRDVWHHVEMLYDFNTQLFCFWIDGDLIAQNITFSVAGAGSTALDRGQFECAFAGLDAMLVDNFVIAQQTGDEIIDAITMCNDFFIGTTTDNTGVTGDDTSCTDNDEIDEWLLWTAPQDCGTATATTCNPGSNYDTALAVFDACGGTQLACNDDDGSCLFTNLRSSVTWNTIPGETYMIRVSGFNGLTGAYELTVSHTPCQSDTDCDGTVNVTDLLALLAAWGSNPGHPADINDDGNVNVTDLLLLLAAWGACP